MEVFLGILYSIYEPSLYATSLAHRSYSNSGKKVIYLFDF
jgi:hypothetical protein